MTELIPSRVSLMNLTSFFISFFGFRASGVWAGGVLS
jgi:hypothetical protein